ncbi:MAG: 1-acyl-sn-glycerol-3-phosphate acyltransferase [Planctomycetes bacterium]|nr:1-acyl-sn-glycerol-3-phosphate acyltransferase [Planctomycetota bacterium]
MIRRLRVGVRLCAILAVTVGLYALWNLGRPFVARDRDASRRWRESSYRRWARTTAHLVGMRRTVRGPVPTGPGLLVANHQGWVDILFLAAETGAVFVSKAEVRDWPLIGRAATSMGTLYVRRGDKRELGVLQRAIADAIDAGELVGFFPEGTSTDGTRLLEFKPSLFEAATSRGRPVHCAALRYRTRSGDPPASTAVAWGDGRAFLEHAVGLLGLRGFDAEVVFADEPLYGTDRKDLAREAEAVVRKLGASPPP